MEQTAVEWLFKQVDNLDWKHLQEEKKIEILDQAKAMEKQQITNGYLLGAYVEQQNNAEELQDKLIEALEFSKKYPEGTPAETIVDDFLNMYKIEDND